MYFSFIVNAEIKERDMTGILISELENMSIAPAVWPEMFIQQGADEISDEIARLQQRPVHLEQLIRDESKQGRKKDSKGLENKIKKPDRNKDDEPDTIKDIKPGLSLEEDYARHTELYRQFHADYLRVTTQAKSAYEFYSAAESRSERNFSWGEEIINYKERKDLVRSMQMNAFMHGGHNHVDPSSKERYEFWKYASKFNLLMSFHMYDTALSCH